MKKQFSIMFLLIVTLMLVFTSCGIANKKVESIQILSGAPTEVEVGQTPDFSDIKVKVTYNDGETKEVGFADVTISNIDTSKVGKVEYTVSYDGGSAKATINVKEAGSVVPEVTLESITYLSGIQTEFYEGAEFHTNNLKVTAHYSDGSTKTVSSGITVVQNINSDTVGEQTLIVEYQGKRCEIKITVLKIEPVRLAFTLNGFENKVLIGKSFDTSAITATLYYNNSSTKSVANADITFTPVDTMVAGEKILVGTYEGISAECNVEVLGIKSIVFSGFENSVKVNGELDLTGLTAAIVATNNKQFTLTAADITVDKTNFNTTLGNTNTKTTVIKFGYCGSFETYNITVTAAREDANILSLEYVSGVKTNLFVGQAFDDTALVARVNRSYGYTSDIARADLTTTDTVNVNQAGTYPVTYSFTEGGVTKSFTINVVVAEPNPSDLVLNTNDLGWVIKGETVDVSGITATLYYEYGTKTTPIANSELTIANVATDTAGKVEITVSHAASGLTATATVTVVEIQSVVFEGVDDRYRVNNQIAQAGVQIIITGTDAKTYVRTVDLNTVIPTLTLDITKTSETKEYVFTYYGVEYKQNIEVYAEFADATLDSIEYSGVTRVILGNKFEDMVSVKANYTYGFTREYTEADGVSFTGNVVTSTVGDYEITVSYAGKTAVATVSVTYPKVTGIVINYAPYAILGEVYGPEKINVTLSLENNTTVTDTLDNLSVYGITIDVNVNTAGKQTLALVANEKSYTKEITVYEIERIVIDTDGFNTVIQLGDEFSTNGLGKILVYLVGRDEPAIREVSEFTHNVNVEVMGSDYELTATYLGITSSPVKITVTEFTILGVEDTASMVAWKQGIYQKKFLDAGYRYFVGDDNPFRYALQFSVWDEYNETLSTAMLKYESVSVVTLDGVPVGEDYVVIDEINHTFDFTELAIGKTFTITTALKGYESESGYSKTIDVTIVDGYNVHEAIELNLITNNETEKLGNSSKYQLKVLYSFLANNQVAGINNMTYDEYVAFVNGINGIIIHDKLVIERSDLPEDYFFITASGEEYLWDTQSIYFHHFTELKLDDPASGNVVPETFNIYGNYFTIISNNIPIVSEQGAVDRKGVKSNNNNELSSSQLFMFDVSSSVYNTAKSQNKFYAENYVANVYALGLHDNEPSVSVLPELAQKRAKLGIIGMKFRHGTYNLNAVNAEAYFISIFPNYDDVIVNVDYCSFYNAWNNHIMTWSSNLIDQGSGNKFDGTLHEGYMPVILNVSNSFIGKCGGPAIISMSVSPEEESNTIGSEKLNITIDDKTNIFSYVKGDEAWFDAYGATGIMSTLLSFNNFFEPNGASFTTTINGNRFINMIFLNLDHAFNPATGAGTNTDLDGKISIGGQAKLDMNDWSKGSSHFGYGHSGVVDAILAGAKAQNYPTMPPIFVSDMGGASYTDTKNLYFADLPGMDAATDKYAATHGNYLAMYLYNLGTLLGFNEPALDAEPTPADCTVERITELHGIN